jgi:protein-tyrosine phosphatase
MNPIIKEHLDHLIRRSISKSPLLKCTSSPYREDLTELVKISSNLDENTRKTSSIEILQNLLAPTPQKVEIFNTHKKNLAKCRKIKNEAEDYFHSTGQLGFYLGYPFVAVPLNSNKFYVAPLFLWVISCKVTATSIILDRVRDDDKIALEPQLNYLLKEGLAYQESINLQWTNTDILNWDNIVTETQAALSTWEHCDKKLDNTQVAPIPNTAALKALEKAKVLPSAIIGYIPIKGQSIVNDLTEMTLSDEDMPVSVIDRFIKKRQEQSLVQANNPVENDKWLVTSSDHSQESVLWNARNCNLMVLQGPPGTGKSQVIVNLIADALAKQKKVLVVCQKKAALDVLKKRLTANGLGELLQLIDNVQTDRMRIITSIKNLNANVLVARPLSQIDMARQTISDNFKKSEDFLDKSNLFLTNNQQKERLTYGNLKARLDELNQQGINVYEQQFETLYAQCLNNNLLPDNINKLKELRAEVISFINDYQGCDYKNNPWVYLENPPNIAQVNILLNSLVKLSNSLENKSTYFYSLKSTWLTEHSWLDDYYPIFLSSASQDIHKNLRNTLTETKKLKQWLNSQYVDTILASIRTSESIEHYHKLQNISGSIGQVLSVKNKAKQSEIFRLFLNNKANIIPNLVDIVECFSLQMWLDNLTSQAWFDNLTSQGTVSTFHREQKQEKEKLADYIEQKRNEDIEHILAKHNDRMLAGDRLLNIGLLRVRATQGKPKTSLRNLYTSGFKLVHQIYPVLLTNPETACSILNLETDLYDLVIIDEASQMFVADALPLLYRAKNAFISGDTKQMPPSDFFMASGNNINSDGNSDDDDDDPIVVRNSFIPAEGEYCLLEAAEYSVQEGNPNHATLSVHYRSEFKELIDFSNHAFYKGKLIASTSNQKLPNIIKAPIELCQINDSNYSAGVNKEEALAVVNRIKEIWKQSDSLSLGVITLNVLQKSLIEDLLGEEIKKDADFYSRFEKERNNIKDGEDISFFVRSVENVQGDERDIIILSTIYDGQINRFGAITPKEKGRKRLNVAITRAKSGVIIYTSLDIDTISNESQKGVSENYWFWKYMCYARAISSGDKIASDSILQDLNPTYMPSKPEPEPDSYFEIDVAEFLRGNGYYVGYQIGEGGFRIDLGVKRNKDDHLYLCGIECDGRQYHSSWTARLNDIWRQNILEKKGWIIIRIWSNDWFDNRAATEKKLLADLNNL